MVFVPFGEWLPDQPAFMNKGAITATGVVPLTKESYGPFPAPSAPYSGATLTNACLGSYIYKDASGNPYNFAGDKSRLYLLATGDTSFQDVSKAGGGPYSVSTSPAYWDMTAFGTQVIATDYEDPVQSYTVGTSTTFTDLSPSAPKARYTAVIRDFLFLGNIFDATAGAVPYRVAWSAIGNASNWPMPGTNAAIEVQSDFQDLQQVDVGAVSGLAGAGLLGADGAAFCEHGIYRIAYVGSPAIFDFAVAQGGVGTISPRSILNWRGIAYYVGEDGCFYAFDGATPSVPIGAQKIDRTFQNDLNPAFLSTVQGAVDPARPVFYWAYSGADSGASGAYNRLLVYNWQINQWSLIDLTGTEIEFLTRWLSLGYTLDQLDAFTNPAINGGGVDSLPYSLDSPFWAGGQMQISMFSAAAHQLQIANGPNLAVTLDTGEQQPFPQRRAKVGMARPIAGGASASIAMGVRDNANGLVSFGPGVAQNAYGWCPQRVTGRYIRAEVTIPAGAGFQILQGVDIEVRPEGRLR